MIAIYQTEGIKPGMSRRHISLSQNTSVNNAVNVSAPVRNNNIRQNQIASPIAKPTEKAQSPISDSHTVKPITTSETTQSTEERIKTLEQKINLLEKNISSQNTPISKGRITRK